MTLYSYLKQFKNIAWYPSAFKDALSMVCLSFKGLKGTGISKEEVPDCFIFTDYCSYYEQQENHRFFLDLEEYEDEAILNYQNSEYTATIFNIKELERLKIGFDQEMVAFGRDNYYGRVFVGDVLIEHPQLGKIITKLVYVLAENTSFAFEFLLKKNIQVKYVIHSRYGHGFGGGISNGSFICNILKDLGTRYLASDMDEYYKNDVADKYLTDEQKNTVPMLKEIINFDSCYHWCGYESTILYEVVGFDAPPHGFFVSPKFSISNQ